jgi:hypothetical protein
VLKNLQGTKATRITKKQLGGTTGTFIVLADYETVIKENKREGDY